MSPFAGDGTVEALDDGRCLLTAGSWTGLAASIVRYDVDFEVLEPPALRRAFAALAARCTAAAES